MNYIILACVPIFNGFQFVDARYYVRRNEQFKKVYITEDDVTRDFNESSKFCEEHDSVLVMPRSQAEYDHVRHFRASSNFWIGAKLYFGGKFSNQYLDGSEITVSWDDINGYRTRGPRKCAAMYGHTINGSPYFRPCEQKSEITICERNLITPEESNQIKKLKLENQQKDDRLIKLE